MFMTQNVFAAVVRHKYIDLVTFRKSGVGVHTPVWFAESDGKLYVMTRSDSGKLKRVRNNPRVEIAPSSVRGRQLGPAIPAWAIVAPDQVSARQAIRRKYFLARVPFLWSKDNVYLELRAAE